METVELEVRLLTSNPKKVTLRPVAARAMQFRYERGRELAERISALLHVEFSTSSDPQSGIGYHVRTGDYSSELLSDGDWVVVDAFGKPAVVKEKDFKVYYDPVFE